MVAKELSPNQTPAPRADAVPKDAAAVVLVRGAGGEAQVFWARRGERMAFLGGFYAFPGGQRDADDAQTPVDNCDDAELAAMISCAARELFEETGVLAARGADSLTKGQLDSLLDDLASRRMTFAGLLAHYGLRLDARDFTFVGRWVTPPFSPRRFDTLFFLVGCPRKQEPRIRTAEFDQGGWTVARAAYERWLRSEILVAPPVLHAIKTLADGAGDAPDDLVARFLSVPQARREQVRRIEFTPGFTCFPLRTPTKPPATHTNAYVIGHGDFVVVDPGSPYEDEQAALAAFVGELIAGGRTLREIVLTHHHPDHVGGVEPLRAHLGGGVRVAAHRLTADALGDSVRVDRFVEEGDVIELAGEPPLHLRAMHTPGHTRGHLSFYEERTETLVVGDNIVGLGSVLIEPPQGSVRDYLGSLERYRRLLPRVRVLFGGHGAAVGNPRAKIEEYIAHRLEREANILKAVREGASTPREIVERVYADVPAKLHAMAERAVLAHLEKLEEDGLVSRDDGGRYAATGAAAS
jgi:glyoxylase-like metal-dependent hydrolase (beta-lactamase superfamily II)/8-oxo-dGTP pyrophosphatase MutT (NUDIX family)